MCIYIYIYNILCVCVCVRVYVCVCMCVYNIRNHYLLVDYNLTEAAVLVIIREGGEEAKGEVGGGRRGMVT